jgi:hypothetical protein
MSQVTVADPDETPAENAAQAPRLELSRVQMNVVFVTILLGLLLSAGPDDRGRSAGGGVSGPSGRRGRRRR